jgi:nucleoside-diphosphate-sugar epimerase
MRIFVSGAGGNLGGKLIAHLCEQSWCEAVVGVDVNTQGTEQSPKGSAKLSLARADLTVPTDHRWRDLLAGSDAIVHLAVANVYPDCSWEDAATSFAMTAILLDAAAEDGACRFVFASSNHVMGGYKDPPLSLGLRPGGLTPDLPSAPGTSMLRAGVKCRPYAYAAAKLFGEQAVVAKARASRGRLTGIAVRIGWCQPGTNHPATLDASGSPAGNPDAVAGGPDDAIDLAWFRGMWLSNRDFSALMDRALLADATAWPSPGVIVNGMSANTNMPWDLEYGRRLIGFEPQDNSSKDLGLVP